MEPIPESNLTPEDHREGRRSVRFKLAEFDKLVKQISRDARSYNGSLEPTDYYPIRKPKKGRTRTLAIEDPLLREAIHTYALLKIGSSQRLYKSHPFLLSQKGTPYSPNSMQRHMATIYRTWAGIKEARSHSGRRTLATHMLKHNQESIKVVQDILGHASAATTIIYQEEPTAQEKRDALAKGRINRVIE